MMLPPERRLQLMTAVLMVLGIPGALQGCRSTSRWTEIKGPPMVSSDIDVITRSGWDPSIRRRTALVVDAVHPVPAEIVDHLADVLTRELAMTHQFDLTRIDPAQICEELPDGLANCPLRADRIPLLSCLGEHDSVLLVTLTELHAYRPLRLRLRTELLNVADGAPLATFTGSWEGPAETALIPTRPAHPRRRLRPELVRTQEHAAMTSLSPRFLLNWTARDVAATLVSVNAAIPPASPTLMDPAGGRVSSAADGPALTGPGLPVGQTRPPFSVGQTRPPLSVGQIWPPRLRRNRK